MTQYTEAAFEHRDTPGPRTFDGWIGIPLSAWREVNSNDIPALSDTPLSDDPAGFGGLLATNTTPALQTANGDTDSSLELSWASSNSNAVIFQTPLPPDFDPSSDLVLHINGYVGGTTDDPVMALDTYFNHGDTKVEDTSEAISETTAATYTATIAAADIPTEPYTVTIEVTPGAHTTDELVWVATWLTYTKLP